MMKKTHDEDEVEPQYETMDLNKPDFLFRPKEQHDWRQQGPYLVCKGCEIQHAVYIGMHNVLVGIDADGKPMLKKR